MRGGMLPGSLAMGPGVIGSRLGAREGNVNCGTETIGGSGEAVEGVWSWGARAVGVDGFMSDIEDTCRPSGCQVGTPQAVERGAVDGFLRDIAGDVGEA